MKTDETAQKAWEKFREANAARSVRARHSLRDAFVAGRASRDAEVAEVRDEVERRRMAVNEWVVEIVGLKAERDAALQALAESRARFGDMEQRALAAEAVIEKVREWNTLLNGQPRYRECDDILASSPSTVLPALIREKQAEAWDEAVETTLNHAIRNEDGITLRLEHLDGRPWANPYRNGGTTEWTDSPTCATCGKPSTYRLGMPEPSWCDAHGPKPDLSPRGGSDG